jgi:hypothetical protein
MNALSCFRCATVHAVELLTRALNDKVRIGAFIVATHSRSLCFFGREAAF